MLKDMLRDTPMYQHILQEGRAEGLEEGMEKERQERLSSLQRKLQAFIELRFPSMEASAKKQIAAIDQPHVLETLVFQIILAHDAEEVERFLLQAVQNPSKLK